MTQALKLLSLQLAVGSRLLWVWLPGSWGRTGTEFLLPGPEVTHTHSLRERSNGPGEFDSLPPPQAHQDLLSCFHAHTSSGFTEASCSFQGHLARSGAVPEDLPCAVWVMFPLMECPKPGHTWLHFSGSLARSPANLTWHFSSLEVGC